MTRVQRFAGRISAPLARLRTKLALVMFLLVVAVVVIFVFVMARTFEVEERKGLELKAAALATLLGESIGNSFFSPGRVDLMRTYLATVRGQPQVIYALAFDADGRILADGTQANSRFNTVIVDEFHARALASDAPLIQYRHASFRHPDNILDVYQPVRQPTGEKVGGVRIGFTLLPIQQRIASVYRLGLLLAVLFLAAAGVVSSAASRRLVSPVDDLVRGTQAIAAGTLDVAIPVRSADELGSLAASFNQMAARLKENTAKLERKVVETETLYELGQEITSQVALEPTLRLVADRARTLLDGDVSLLALREAGGEWYHVRAYSGPVSDELACLRFRPGEGLGGLVAATGRPAIIGDYQAELPESPFRRIVGETGIRAQVAVPLKVHNDVLGVLYVSSRSPGRFREDDQVLLGALADQAAIGIENARLYEDVRRHAEELEVNVEARTRELQEANRNLEIASQHKTQFLANMSHELRTPLNAIMGYTELIVDGIYGDVPAKIRETLGRVQQSSRHLLGLINDVLDLSKIEAGELRLSLSDYSMADVVRGVATAVEALAGEKHLALSTSVPPDLPTGQGDERRITQVLLNLVGNAIKFTEAGAVTIGVAASNGEFAVRVTDTGPGISSRDQERIFQEFQQVDSSSTRTKGGTGLGLSIARKIVTLHGGRMWVESDLGKGSTFIFTLPVRAKQS